MARGDGKKTKDDDGEAKSKKKKKKKKQQNGWAGGQPADGIVSCHAGKRWVAKAGLGNNGGARTWLEPTTTDCAKQFK
uniref:Uncharacterized protein n=1 Tax=Caenorhabditis japonica TaxID=281687 RepID=A0A8R1EV29_CAEJA